MLGCEASSRPARPCKQGAHKSLLLECLLEMCAIILYTVRPAWESARRYGMYNEYVGYVRDRGREAIYIHVSSPFVGLLDGLFTANLIRVHCGVVSGDVTTIAKSGVGAKLLA